MQILLALFSMVLCSAAMGAPVLNANSAGTTYDGGGTTTVKSINITANNVTVKGYIIDNDAVETKILVNNADDVVIRDNMIRQGNGSGNAWAIVIKGGSQRTQILYNEFDRTNGIQILGWQADNNNTDTLIKGNYFHGLAWATNVDFIQDASIRCSTVNNQPFVYHTVIDGNLFENITNVDELVSLKAGYNQVINNTFDTTDELRLRASHNTLVENNYFTAMDSIGVNGPNHIIRGNYMNNTPIIQNAANYTFPDPPADGCGSSEQTRWRTQDWLIENNDFNGNSSLQLNNDLGGAFTLTAQRVTVRNNRWSLTQGNAITDQDATNPTLTGNTFNTAVNVHQRLTSADVGIGKGGTAPVAVDIKTDFLTIPSCLVWENNFYNSQAQRTTCANALLQRHYTHVYHELTSSVAGGYSQPNFFSAGSAQLRPILQQFVDAGLKNIVFLVGDDDPWRNNDAGTIKNAFSTMIPAIDDLVDMYVLGIESDEYWSKAKTVDIGAHLRTLTAKPIGVHQLPQKWDYCMGESWCDFMALQYGFGLNVGQITSITQQAISALGGKPLVAMEYNNIGQSEQTSILLGDAAIAAGADGCGNGCTSTAGTGAQGKYEAEVASLTGFTVESGVGTGASGDFVTVSGGDGSSGTATFSVGEAAGDYTLYVSHGLEDDGVSSYVVKVNGVQVDSWTTVVGPQWLSFTERAIGVTLTANSTITVTSTRTANNKGRLDYIRLGPPGAGPSPFSGSVTLSWNQSYLDTSNQPTDVLDFSVKYKPQGGAYSAVRTVTDTNSGSGSTVFNFPTALQASSGDTVCFKVSARNSAGSSTDSNEACKIVANAQVYQCSDGLDNDGDGKIDYPADPGCMTADDDSEADAAAVPAHTLLKFYVDSEDKWGYARLQVDAGCALNRPIETYGDESRFTVEKGKPLVDPDCPSYTLNTNLTLNTVDVCHTTNPCVRPYISAGFGACTGAKCFEDRSVGEPANQITVLNGQDLNAAINNASAGTTIYVEPGTYDTVSIVGKNNPSGSPIVVVNRGGGAVTISNPDNTPWESLNINNSSYFAFDGITIVGGGKGINVLASDHIIFNNMDVSQTGNAGLEIRKGSSYVDFIGGKVHNTGTYEAQYGECFYVGSAENSPDYPETTQNVWIEGVEIYSCGKGEAVDFKAGVKNSTVKGNNIHDIAPGTAGQTNDGAVSLENDTSTTARQDNWVTGNTISNVSGGTLNHGITFYGGGNAIKSNTVSNVVGTCIRGNNYLDRGYTTYVYGNSLSSCGTTTSYGGGMVVSTADPGTNPRSKQTWYPGTGSPQVTVGKFVSPVATGTGTGTYTDPWNVNQASVCSGCQPGDTIYFRGGTYTNANFMYSGPSGTSANPITFRNYPGEVPQFFGVKDNWSYQWGSNTNVSNIVLQGMWFDSYRGVGFGRQGSFTTDNITYRYNVFNNGASAGVQNGRAGAFGGAQGSQLVEYNIASRNGNQTTDGWSAGIHMNPNIGVVTVRGNVSFHNFNGNPNYNTDGGGIMFDEGGANTNVNLQHIIENNLAFENGGYCITSNAHNNSLIRNNTCYSNKKDTRQPANYEIQFSLGNYDGHILRNNIAVATRSGTASYGAVGTLTNFTKQGNHFYPTDSAVSDVFANPDILSFGTKPVLNGVAVAGATSTTIGFDRSCIKATTTTQPLAWWRWEPDIDYMRQIGGIERCFSPQPRATTAPGAY